MLFNKQTNKWTIKMRIVDVESSADGGQFYGALSVIGGRFYPSTSVSLTNFDAANRSNIQ
jgi:hypothetical protein